MEAPDDVLSIAKAAANEIETEAYGNDEGGGYFQILKACEIIARAIMAERNRCSSIIGAECEWGGYLRDAQRRIDAGEDPRRIPGWNAPSEDA